MSFETFSAKVINKIGFKIQIKFYSEEGKHTAVIPGGIVIVGNVGANKVWIKWGSGHSALIEI